MRVFIAIELSDDVKDYIEKRQKIIKKYSEKGNFSYRENFHLTLRFIGEVDYDEIERIKTAINETACINKEFYLQLGELGYFPRKNKKIIWIGINKGHKNLRSLFNDLEKNLVKQGFNREERGLKPHITIGREVIMRNEFDYIKKQVNIEPLKILVDKISLMESTRINGKLTYIPIYTKNMLSYR
ncbi:RNA 2',3'-cyclic phosphodiesterase [Caminicella sporogenes]|uniref:RNA 2',3'-cyclic phosphodiesterase n=1 Tax=Caminicella sporogenes TaxID=166485 RepID=UPI0025416403|nr:RNA 2',3'-cyclic phosphodiesterase [Caminicella sporogenes]WIF95362.1 RNA 2',3'-cyclic phosphodiesterase [Caminicella sporogenes]